MAEQEEQEQKKSGVLHVIFFIITIPFRIIFWFIKSILSLLGVAFGDNSFAKGFKSGYSGNSPKMKEYTFTNSMGCTQTVYSSDGVEFYDVNGSYVGRSDDGGKTIH
ncbi:MAG: hypothetical protein ACI4MC_00675 [Candidatus Coproplasma sp.]